MRVLTSIECGKKQGLREEELHNGINLKRTSLE